MSLKALHLFFILLSIVGADFFAVWAVWGFATGQADNLVLALGVLSALGGLGLTAYAVRLVRRFDAFPVKS